MRFLSLFSGIEAASVAWIPLGWECVGLAEIEPFPCAVTKHHFPNVKNFGNVESITEGQVRNMGKVDVIIAGFPCQDLSVAGNRKGLKNADGTNTRSGLFYTAMRIFDWAKPRWVVLENVPGLFSSHEGRDFASVVGELAGCEFSVPRDGWRTTGVALGPKGLVEWVVLDAQYFGLAQRRKRVFIVRDSGYWVNRPPLFLNAQSMRGDSPPSRQAGQRIAPTTEGRTGRSGCNNFNTSGGLVETAPTLSARTKGGGGLGTDFDCDGGLIARSLTSSNERLDGESENFIIAGSLNANGKAAGSATQQDAEAGLLIAHSLRADGFDASEDGTGRGTPIVALPLGTRVDRGGSHREAQGNNLIPFDTTQITSKANYSSPKGGDPCHPLAEGGHPPAIAQTVTADMYRSGGAVAGNNNQGVRNCFPAKQGVRRLTPKECERLQGFPDRFTEIERNGKPTADGPRYKALGNSMAVPVIKWIGNRIRMLEELLPYDHH